MDPKILKDIKQPRLSKGAQLDTGLEHRFPSEFDVDSKILNNVNFGKEDDSSFDEAMTVLAPGSPRLTGKAREIAAKQILEKLDLDALNKQKLNENSDIYVLPGDPWPWKTNANKASGKSVISRNDVIDAAKARLV